MSKVFFTFVATLIFISGFSQSRTELSKKRSYYGISLGFIQSSVILENDLPKGYRAYDGSGFNIGIISEINFSKYFSLSPKFEVTFTDSRIERNNLTKGKIVYRVLPISLDFMAHAIIKTGKSKLNPYLFIGPNYKKALKGPDKESIKWNEKSNIALDFGLGLELFFKKFIISPGLRYSYGLTNISSLKDIESIKMNTISLVFVFKG